MISRLASLAPDIKKALASLPRPRKTAITIKISLWAVEKLGAKNEEVNSIIKSNDAALAESLAMHYDELYFKTEGTNPTDSLQYFCLARAVSSLAFAFSGSNEEAVYEAIIATNDLPSILKILNSSQ